MPLSCPHPLEEKRCAMEQFDRLTVIDHPLVSHKIALIRDKNTSASVFRTSIRELTYLEAFEATKHLKTKEITVETPLATTTGKIISGQEPVIVPILRAGLSMLEGMLEIIPNAAVAHLGMCRNEETREPMEYYAKMPSFIAERQVIIIDPMLATGGSLKAAIANLRERGVKDIVAMVLVAAPEGVKAVLESDPEVRLFTCALDEGLNDRAYILPGLGDAGDRIYQTFDTPAEGSRVTQ